MRYNCLTHLPHMSIFLRKTMCWVETLLIKITDLTVQVPFCCINVQTIGNFSNIQNSIYGGLFL